MNELYRATGVADMAGLAAECLEQVRAAGDHETGDRAEADMATAVRIIWDAAGPMLRAAILETVMMGCEE
jgi:hypothetical protein